jgi:hypothetical protein
MTDTDTREHLAQIIKCFTVQSPNEFEGKFKDSVTVNEWFRRLYFTLNTNDSLLKLLPAPDGDVSDKYNIYLFQKDFSKEGLGSDAEISNELPAFAYFLLNEWEIPSWIERSARLGIVSYHNPEATKMIWESSSESGLWQYIVNIMVVNKTERYHGTSQQIFLQISSDLQNTKLSRKVWEGIKVERFGYLLRSIKRQAGEFVERSAGNDPATWTIVCPQALPPKTWIDDKLEKMRGETF